MQFHKFCYLAVTLLTLAGSRSLASEKKRSADSLIVKRDTTIWIDESRNRRVPVAIYTASGSPSLRNKRSLVILNPGYPGKNTDYSYIAKALAALGYYVVAIQHDLPTDAPIPMQGDIYQARLPFWNTGVANMLFVIGKLKVMKPELDYRHLILIGHSNGGDIAMLMGQQHPEMISTIISLDNRRVPLPLNKQLKVFAIRSGDQVADPGVLPSEEDTRKYGIQIVKVSTPHNDMGGSGTPDQLAELNRYIVSFLSAKDFIIKRN